MTAPPVAWVVCARFGEHSQPWIWRQVTAFRRIRPEVVAGGRENADAFPLDIVPLHLLPAVGARPATGARWLRRASGLAQRNFMRLEPAHTRALVSLARQRRPQVALCHFGHVALRVLPAAREVGVPVVAHFHGLDLSSSLRNRWYRWSLEASLGKLDAAVVVGRHQQEWLTAHGFPGDRVHLIPCGVPVAAYRVRRHRETRRVRFVAVSRLVAWKGVDVSLRAFARLARRQPGATLDVIGDGPERGALQRLRDDLGVGGAVTFHGALPPRAVSRALGSADVFLQHSISHANGTVEGFGISITEAAASGLPVVVSRCGGIVDQVVDGHNGFLVDQHDTAAMAERMLDLAADAGLRQRMGAAGRRTVEERFDLDRQVARLESVLLDVARTGPPRRQQPLSAG